MTESAESPPEWLSREEMAQLIPDLKQSHAWVLIGDRIYCKEKDGYRLLGNKLGHRVGS